MGFNQPGERRFPITLSDSRNMDNAVNALDTENHISVEEYRQYLKTGLLPWEQNKKKTNKYRAEKCELDGIRFDSIKEARRYSELKTLEKAGLITDLMRQVKYELIPPQKDEDGKIIERAVVYKADFVYTDTTSGRQVVEDTKGLRTKDYVIKRKLMLYMHGIRITEI